GRQIPLTEVPQWAQLSPHAEITGIDAPLFAYLRVPGANPTDRKSPLGVSVYSRAVHLIQDADQQYGRLLWEFEGGELAVDAAEDVLRQTEGGDARLPKTKDRLFRRLSSSGRDFYEVFSPALRDASLKNGLDIILKRIEFTCALAYGTLSDPQNVDKTAEEVRSSKQRSYAAVRDIQNALQHALDDLLYAAGKYADIYRLAPAGDCVAAYDWGDSITDKDKEREQMRQDCRDHAAQWWEYRMRFYGEDETTAKKNAGAAEAELDPFQLDDPRKNLAGN
ncbi:MAG: capsid protein, partial [Ruthenibacterium sp.]